MNPEPAFQEHTSGLLVPKEVVRKRQVFTKEEWRLLDRVSKLFHTKGVALLMECDNPACTKKIQQVATPGAGLILRCQCTDRVLQKAF